MCYASWFRSVEIGQLLSAQDEFNGPSFARGALYVPTLLQSKDDLMRGGRRHLEVALDVCLCRGVAVDLRVVVDEREVLPLLPRVT